MSAEKKARVLTPIQVAALHGWCSWPVPKAVHEEQERFAKQHGWQLEQLMAEIEVYAAGKAKAERLRQEHGPNARYECNGDRTITVIEGH